jgi:glycosyltransferase involved in cell wall biosynthesis
MWDALDAASMLEISYPGLCQWTFAGSGPELQALRQRITELKLDASVRAVGEVDPREFIQLIDDHHAVASPTRSTFIEGLQKVALEGILRGRPVITTEFSNAFDRFAPGLVQCDEASPSSLAHAVKSLAMDPSLYQEKARQCLSLARQLFDRSMGYRQALSDLLDPKNRE